MVKVATESFRVIGCFHSISSDFLNFKDQAIQTMNAGARKQSSFHRSRQEFYRFRRKEHAPQKQGCFPARHRLIRRCRSIRIKKAPLVLAIHLKRFKYIEQLQRHKKLSYRVPFSTELRIPTVRHTQDKLPKMLLFPLFFSFSATHMTYRLPQIIVFKTWDGCVFFLRPQGLSFLTH